MAFWYNYIYVNTLDITRKCYDGRMLHAICASTQYMNIVSVFICAAASKLVNQVEQCTSDGKTAAALQHRY